MTHITGVSLWIYIDNDALAETFGGAPPIEPGDFLPGIQAHISNEYDSDNIGIFVDTEDWPDTSIDAIVQVVTRTFDNWVWELVAEQAHQEE